MRGLAIALLLAVGALIAVTVNLSKAAALHGVPGPEFAFWLALGAGLVLLSVARARGERIQLSPLHLRFYAVSGLLSLTLPNILSFAVAAHAGASYASVSFALSPLMTYPMAIAVGLDSAVTRRIAGLLLGAVGTALVLSEMSSGPTSGSVVWLLAALSIPAIIASGNVYRSLRWPPGSSDIGLAAAMLLSSAVWLAPLVAARPVAAFANGSIGAPELIVLAQIAASSAMYRLYFWLQRIAGPVYLSQIGYVGAGFGIIFAIALFAEPLAWAMLAGLALIALGVTLVRPRRDAEAGGTTTGARRPTVRELGFCAIITAQPPFPSRPFPI